ncbi:MAG: RHS repeat-associated core domain-containing protein, partial [Reichenbachiella sp.]|uniref:RHS repeat domain-containing protein n=2 Tax=Reichenbachiella sp. TaxID=2184521 RepID=UPI003267C736
KDHLGNVRAVVVHENDDIDEKQHTDYYPFGMAMTHAGSRNHRFGYQGEFAEYDQETGFNHFELREYDQRIGRFMVPDPYRQFASPYMAMGNNPINGVDPDGGCFTRDADGNYIECPEADIGATMNGAFGYEWTFGEAGWDLTNAADVAGYLAYFSAAPEEVIGTAKYYEWRYVEHIEKYGTRPPDYYLGYGHKYINRFSTELNPTMSADGQAWLTQTRLELQYLMETGLQENPAMELDNPSFHSFAFDTHVPAYTKGDLLKDLSFSDQWKILRTPDMSDLFSSDGIRQVINIFPLLYPADVSSYNHWNGRNYDMRDY